MKKKMLIAWVSSKRRGREKNQHAGSDPKVLERTGKSETGKVKKQTKVSLISYSWLWWSSRA